MNAAGLTGLVNGLAGGEAPRIPPRKFEKIESNQLLEGHPRRFWRRGNICGRVTLTLNYMMRIVPSQILPSPLKVCPNSNPTCAVWLQLSMCWFQRSRGNASFEILSLKRREKVNSEVENDRGYQAPMVFHVLILVGEPNTHLAKMAALNPTQNNGTLMQGRR